MKAGLVIACLLLFTVVKANRIGSIKNSASFTNTDALGLSTLDVDVYSTRSLGQVGIGDVLYTNVGMTTPVAGGSTWWGFIITDNASGNIRGYKIDGSGVVIDVVITTGLYNAVTNPGGGFSVIGYHNNSGAANCAGTGFSTPIYAARDDPGFYSNKKIFNSSGGQTTPNASYTISLFANNTAFATYVISGGSSAISSLSCCVTNPISDAGSDASYNMPSPAITLIGAGYDCNGTISTYAWSRVSGPNTPTIVSSSSSTTDITGVIAGTYVFQLQVTDNGGNSSTDNVTITVFGPLLVANPQKLPTQRDEVYGMEGEDNRGVYGTSWNYYDAGTMDPVHGSSPTGKFDFDSTTSGWQLKQTTGQVQRLNHDYFRSGLGRGVLREKDTIEYISKIYIYDTTGDAGHTIKFYIGNLSKIQKARWPADFGSVSPDYTYTTKNVAGWDSLPLTGQDSGQYIYAVFDYFSIDVAIIPYGAKSTYNTVDTTINRKRSMVATTDTLLSAFTLHGINNDGALPGNNANYPNDSLPYHKGGGMRFYLAPIKTGPTTIVGMSDADNVTWTGPYTSTNKIYLNPFVPGSVGSDNPYIQDSIIHRRDGIPIMNNDRGVNAKYASESGYNPEHWPKNTAASNPRTRLAWERRGYEIECKIAKFYQTTSPANPSKYRYADDRWPGVFGLNFFSPVFELDNEKDEGFRSDSAYMSPEIMMFHHSMIYDTLHALQPSLKILTNAFVSYNTSALRAMIKNAYLYYGTRRVFFNGISWHTTVCEEEYDHTPTSDDLLGQHGAWPGKRNERLKMANTMLDIDRELGRHVDWYLTEVSYTKDSIGPSIGSPTYSDAAYSLIGAPQVKSHTPEENQAILYANLMWDYFAIPGVKSVLWYTNKDATASTSPYRKNADGSNGISNYIDIPPVLYPAYYYFPSFIKRFPDWRFKQQIQYDLGGYTVDQWEKIGNSDSAMYLVRNQNRNDASSPITLNVGNASTVTRLQPSLTSFNVINAGSQAITLQQITVTGRPEGDMYVFYSTIPTLNPPVPIRMRIRIKTN
jgi:hypothetical protein